MATKDKAGDDSGRYYYHCAHGASNDPCPEGCFPRDAKKMPANWLKTYEPETPPGVTDASNLGK